MKDIDRLAETFTAIGVPFKREEAFQKPGEVIIVDELPGYSGFFAEFAFNADGTFNLKSSGCYE